MVRIICIFILCSLFIQAKGQKGFSFVEKKESKKIEVRFEGKLLTAYCYFDSTEKPVLYPVKTLSGITVTRGYPVDPRPGERADHPHQVGIWFTYESVNGLDFWNNSFAIPAERKSHYGSIKFIRVVDRKTSGNKAQLTTLSHWVDQAGKILLEETTTFNFQVEKNKFVIDRECSLKAVTEDVEFKDVKDGVLGMRVARSLEMPSQQQDVFVNDDRSISTSSRIDNTGVTGIYRNHEGLEGDSAWAKRSSWTYLTGKKDGKQITIGIIDHPSNVGYPTYWHARGYGLFAANPLGQKIFSNGKEELNYKLKKDQSLQFKFRILIAEEAVNAATMNSYMQSFQKQE